MKGARVVEVPGIDAIAPQPDGAEVLVAHGDRLRGAPALADLLPRGEEVHVTLERRLKHLVPVHEVGHERQSLSGERVEPRAEDIGDPAFVDKRSHLTFANGQLGAILDFHVLHGIPGNQNAILGLRVVDDINKLFLQEVLDRHGLGESSFQASCSITDWPGICSQNRTRETDVAN